MMPIETQGFVEQVLAGYPPAIGKLVLLVVCIVAGFILITAILRSKAFKLICGALVLLIIAGFFINYEAMMGAVNRVLGLE